MKTKDEDPESRFILGGLQMLEDTEEGLELIQESAEEGYAPAQHILGMLNKENFPQIKKAAREGYAPAQHTLGEMHRKGIIPGKEGKSDYKSALFWHAQAAHQGLASSQFEAGLLLWEDCKEEAIEWFRKAALQGHASAQGAYGKVLSEGTWIEKDLVEGYKWLTLAILSEKSLDIGKDRTTGRLFDEFDTYYKHKDLRTTLSQDERREARDRALRWIEGEETREKSKGLP